MPVRMIVAVAVAAVVASVAAALLMGDGGGDGDGGLFGKKDDRPPPATVRATVAPPPAPTALTVAATNAGLDPAAATVVVRLDPATGLTVDDTALADDQLDQVLARAYQYDPDSQVLFIVAPTIPHARVVDAIDRARSAGLRRIGVSTPDGDAP